MRTCAKCGVAEEDCKKIHAHHKNENRKDNACENLIYLCASCHRKYHKGHWDYTSSGLQSSHISEKDAVVRLEDRHLIIPEPVYLRLEDIAAEERKKVDNPVIKAMITPKSVAQKILEVGTNGKVKFK